MNERNPTIMLRKIFLVVLLVPIFFIACKKEEQATPSTFVIDGVHDLAFGNHVYTTYIKISISQATGTPEPVAISVTGLPAGIVLDLSPTIDTPAFTADVVFHMVGNTTVGTYPVRIVGSSASCTRAYDLNITIPPFNGFIVDGLQHRTGNVSRNGSVLSIYSPDQGGYTLHCETTSTLPIADGAYTYKLTDEPNAANEMSMDLFNYGITKAYRATAATGNTVTLTIVAGQMFITLPQTQFEGYLGASGYVAVSASVSE